MLLLTLLALITMFIYELNQRVNKQPSLTEVELRDDSAFFQALEYVSQKQIPVPSDKTLNLVEKPIQGAQVYYWIDDTGQRHYSDVPVSDAEEITLVPNLVHMSK